MIGRTIHNIGTNISAGFYAILHFLRVRTGFLIAAGALLMRTESGSSRARKTRSGKKIPAGLLRLRLETVLSRGLLPAFIVLAGFIWAVTALPDEGLSDDGWHWHYIKGVMAGGFAEVTVYHIVIAYVMKALALDS